MAMPVLIRDYETRSVSSLKACGAWIYTKHPTTEVLCCAYAVDDGEIELWTPGDPIPHPFLEAANDPSWLVCAFNDQFERWIEQHIMEPRYGWPRVPIGRHRCLQAAGLAFALPASLDAMASALTLPVRKDLIGHRNMLAMSRPRQARVDEDRDVVHWHDDAERRALLHGYCRQDVATERALYKRIGFLSPEEQAHWVIDARINDRGVPIDRRLLESAIKIVDAARRELAAEIAGITRGVVTGISQTARIMSWLAANGCAVTDLQKPTLRKALTRSALPAAARRVIELRLSGAIAAASKLKTMRAWMDEDDRIRGAFRYHGASTGRFSSLGVQLQNMKRAAVTDMAGAIAAVMTGDLDHLRRLYPQPIEVIGSITRALICASAGRKFLIADLSGIESRVVAWISGQRSKLDMWAAFDRSGDPDEEPYRRLGIEIFGLAPEQARDIGKTADLAFSYMGSIGAWRKLAPADDTSTDAQILRRRDLWRNAHPHTAQFWTKIDRAAKIAIRIPGTVVPASDSIAFRHGRDGFLRLRLPSGRRLTYPFARLKTVGTPFYGGTVVSFMDSAAGRWSECRHGHGAYGGLWTENGVQAIARDIFVEGMQRLEAAGYEIVLHAHDEVCAEVADNFGSLEEFSQIFTAPPVWAKGLPLTAKARNGERFAKIGKPNVMISEPVETEDAQDEVSPESSAYEDEAVGGGDGDSPALNGAKLDTPPASRRRRTTLIDLIGNASDPTWSGKVLCPFHDDHNASLHLYDDEEGGHYHCFVCGAHGTAVDFLMMVEGLDRAAALELLAQEPTTIRQIPRLDEVLAETAAKRQRALQLWDEAKPIQGTLAERYLAETRRIDLAALSNADACLRFHSRCPFGFGVRPPCLIALRRDVLSDEPTGIHRIALTVDAQRIDRRCLGRGGVVKLYPKEQRLIVGEGIETTLAAATRVSRWGSLLQPAWSAVAAGMLGNLPVIGGVERLIILVDHDLNGAGQAAALRCAERWSRAGREVVRLTPKRPGTDFNDLVLELAS
jgi:DNA polymerase